MVVASKEDHPPPLQPPKPHVLPEPLWVPHTSRMLHLLLCLAHGTTLSNRYVALRHGQSEANVQGIISSEPSVATMQHGLSATGREQAEKAALALIELARASGCGLAIVTSDFKRALETARAVHATAQEAGVPLWPEHAPRADVRLRERFFGMFNGESDANYQRVWDKDALDADHQAFGVESVSSVVARTGELLAELEDCYEGGEALREEGQRWLVCVVAHGDVLQILQCAHFEREDPRRHRSLEHLQTATPRELIVRQD